MIVNTKNLGGTIINLGGGLPKTGQTTSYQAGDDGSLQTGFSGTRFEVLNIGGDDVVKDYATGLMWPKNATGLGGGNGTLRTWSDSITYCNNLSFAGFGAGSWHLPNVIELFSIVDFETLAYPNVQSIFDNFLSSTYWSSTTYNITTSMAWRIHFMANEVRIETKTNLKYLLACRSY